MREGNRRNHELAATARHLQGSIFRAVLISAMVLALAGTASAETVPSLSAEAGCSRSL